MAGLPPHWAGHTEVNTSAPEALDELGDRQTQADSAPRAGTEPPQGHRTPGGSPLRPLEAVMPRGI